MIARIMMPRGTGSSMPATSASSGYGTRKSSGIWKGSSCASQPSVAKPNPPTPFPGREGGAFESSSPLLAGEGRGRGHEQERGWGRGPGRHLVDDEDEDEDEHGGVSVARLEQIYGRIRP